MKHYLISIFLCAVLVSCASHKTAVGVEKENRTEVHQQDTAITHVAAVDSASNTSVTSDESASSAHIQESGTDEVVTSEHVVETVDADGNRTTTTDRTTTSKSTSTRNADYEQWQRQQEENTALLLSRLDSMAEQYRRIDSLHTESDDSTFVDEQRSASNPVSWWQSLKNGISSMVFLVICVIGLGMWCKRFFEKDGKK